MVVLNFLAIAILGAALWPRGRHSKSAVIIIVLLAAASSAGLWGVIIVAARLPRRLTSLQRAGSIVAREVVAASDRRAYLRGGLNGLEDHIVVLALPEASIEGMIPIKERVGFPVAAGIHGDHALLAYFDTQEKLIGLALFEKARLVVPLGRLSIGPYVKPFITWDSERGGFAVHIVGAIEFTPEDRKLFPVRTDLIETSGVHHKGRSRSFELPEGAVSFVGGAPGPGGFWVVSERGKAWSFDPQEDRAVHTLVAREPDKVFTHAGQLSTGLNGSEATHILSAEGPVSLMRPPSTRHLTEIFPRVRDNGAQEVCADWILEDEGRLGRVQLVSGRRYSMENIDSGAPAKAFGDIERGTSLTELDEELRPVRASYFPGDSLARCLLLRSGDELVVLDGRLEQRARLDFETMERLDPPPTLQAIRDRLAVWGGRSAFFEFALAAGLGLSLLLLPLMGLLHRTRESRFGQLVTVQRFAILSLLLAAPTALAALVRLLHL